jgi:ATP synthase protein I
MELPFVLVSGVVIGGGLGWLLDRWLHTSPLCMLILGFLGFGGGVWSVIKTVLRQS